MCVGFWTLTHPEYALILCTNRDEWMARPTQPAHWHSFDHDDDVENVPLSEPEQQERRQVRALSQGEGQVLSGIDIIAGGTWFGINRRGRVALLTNITEPATVSSNWDAASHTTPITYKRPHSSRGHLVSSFLLHREKGVDVDLKEFVGELTGDGRGKDTGKINPDVPMHSGFNLLVLEPRWEAVGNLNEHVSVQEDNIAQPSLHAAGRYHCLLHYHAALLTNNGTGNPIVPASQRLSQSPESHSQPQLSTSIGPTAPPPLICEGMSNGTWDGRDIMTGEVHKVEDAEWEKVKEGKEAMRGVVSCAVREGWSDEELVEGLLDVLKRTHDVQPPSPLSFRRNIMINAVSFSGGAAHPLHSVQHDQDRLYATRLASVVLVRRNGEVLFVEKDRWVYEHVYKEEEGKVLRARFIEDGEKGDHERWFRFHTS